MNLDFILFSGPKIKYKFVDFWGETIFIPSYSAYLKDEKNNKNIISEFMNCYKAHKTTQVYFSVDNALGDVQRASTISESQGTTNTTNQPQNFDLKYITHYIPCLYLDSMVRSKYIILYFHAAGEDIKIAHGLLNFIRNSYQTNVLAMEYPGYSIYQGPTNSEIANKNARDVYEYVNKQLGFQQENIIVMGRSIGTGIALELMKNPQASNKVKTTKKLTPRALVLISPFASIKNLIKQFVGKIGTFLAKEHYNNEQNISDVQCPVFVLHGKKDSLVPSQHSKSLIKKCPSRSILITPEEMTHSIFDYYADLVDPLRQFLLEQGVNFYEQNMEGPKIPQQLFHCPQSLSV